jgi:DNA-binding beta-propeller fold protein YncE
VRTSRFFGLALIAFGCGLPSLAPAKTIYQIDQVIPMKGKSPSWDYVTFDNARNYVFLGRRAAGVVVYDITNKKEVARIAKSEGANSATLIPEFNRGYTTNGDGTTTIFELSSLKTLDRVKIGPSADNAFYDSSTKQIVFTMGDDQLLTFVDAKTGKVTGTLKLQAEELEGAVMDGKGSLFIAERDINKAAKIDLVKHSLVAEYPTTGCDQPTGAAIDVANSRLFFGCKGEKPVLFVMDTESGKSIAAEPIGRGNDGVVYDADTHRVFTTNGIDGNLVIYSQDGPDNYSLDQAVTTRPIARTISIDPKTKTIFTMTAEGMVDPAVKRNTRAGAFYPNKFFDDTFSLLVLRPHELRAVAVTH